MARKPKALITDKNKNQNLTAFNRALAEHPHTTNNEKFALIDYLLTNRLVRSLTKAELFANLKVTDRAYRNGIQRGKPKINVWDDRIANAIKEIRKANPTFGIRYVTDCLFVNYKIDIGDHAVRRYMIRMGYYTPPNKTKRPNPNRKRFKRIKRQDIKKENLGHGLLNPTGSKYTRKGIVYSGKVDANGQPLDPANANEIYGSDGMSLTSMAEGNLRIFPIIDFISKIIVNWCYVKKGDDLAILHHTINMALKNKNVIMFHSGHDHEFINNMSEHILQKRQVFHSFADVGASHQNGIVESFNHYLARRLQLRKTGDRGVITHEQMMQLTDEQITLYNQIQKHRNDKGRKIGECDTKHREYVSEGVKNNKIT